jgi:4'-phosphopantetheinyl transferase
MQVYISGIQPFMDLNGIALVTAKWRERIHAYIQAADKTRSLVAGLLLRRFCGVADDSHLILSENGKLYLKDNRLFFNISHSGDYVVLAIADRETGVDIEKITPYDNAVAARCFTTVEQEWLRNQGTDEAFFTLWTAKESVMKGSGLGFSLPPETFCVLPIDKSPHRINGGEWFLNWFTHDGHITCGAISGKAEKNKLIIVSWDELLY